MPPPSPSTVQDRHQPLVLAKPIAQRKRVAGSARSPLVIAVMSVTLLATAIRMIGINTWSMWEDEEGSLTRSYESLSWGFQKYFPIFFAILRQYIDLVGLSSGALRVLPAAAGVFGIIAMMIGFRRFASPTTLTIAGLFLAVNVGHLFFSQSVRYYTLVLLLETISLVWFYQGFEQQQPWKVALSLLAFVIALLTHFSALLLGPVFAAYLLLMAIENVRIGGYRLKWYCCTGAALLVIAVLFTQRMLQLRAEFDGGLGVPLASQRSLIHLCKTMIAYIGLPMILLGLAAPWVVTTLSRRTLSLLLLTAIVPVLELLTLTALNMVNVAWYYGFISVVGFGMLAAATLESLWTQGKTRIASLLVVLSFSYSLGLVGLYVTSAHGDRPRWEDAANWIHAKTGANYGKPDNPPLFSNVPGPVGFYLGTPPSQPERDRFVQALPRNRDLVPCGSWFIVEPKSLPPADRAWLTKNCYLRVTFESYMGPVDRSVAIYEYVGPD
jgi:hypothetical protein